MLCLHYLIALQALIIFSVFGQFKADSLGKLSNPQDSNIGKIYLHILK